MDEIPGPPADIPPDDGEDWLGLSADDLPVERAGAWLVRPDCGASVVFTGTARDHSEDRHDVELLSYEAYEDQVCSRLADIATEARRRWPAVARLVMLHRTGELGVGDVAVVVGASAPHRADAFDAARFCIDAVKASVPIWKRERWSAGDDWGLDGAELVHPEAVPSPPGPASFGIRSGAASGTSP